MGATMYDFTVPLAGATYKDVLTTGLDYASTLGLVVQQRPKIADTVTSILSALQPYLVTAKPVTSWPGTQLLSDRPGNLQYTYTYSSDVIEIILATTESIFDWANPERPDDLHLLRADGSTWLASIGHEEEAWLELRDAELSELRERHPSIAALLKPTWPDGPLDLS